MRKLLLALPVLLCIAQAARGACRDTTFILSRDYNPSTLNAYIDACPDTSGMKVTLEYTGNDTVRLANEIVVTSRPAGTVTEIVGKGPGGGPLILTESNTSDPTLLQVNSPDRARISNISFVRRAVNQTNHTVTLGAKGSVITDCQFYMADNSSAGTGALVAVTADSVLIERSLFRTAPGGKGRSLAISGNSNSSRVEIRSNVFYGTGLYLTAGTYHIFANTFAGPRDDYPAITVGSGITDPKAVNVQHNLFAAKADTLSPILFASTSLTSVDSVSKNAWTRSRNIPFISNGATPAGTVATPNATLANSNVLLPRGFSRYGANVGDFKEYPLVQLRSDETLSRSHSDYGRMPRIYDASLSKWTSTMPNIATGLPAGKLWFPNFTPHIAGKSWSTGQTKVGAFVDLELREPVTPLDSGTLASSSLRISRHPSDSTRMRITGMDFHEDYYGNDVVFAPVSLYFFFSTNTTALASNDTTALKTAVGTDNLIRRAYSNFDSVLVVPKGVRTGNTIYVKMLHFDEVQAPVLSSAVIASVAGIPSFPANDLSVPQVLGTSVPANGTFNISVTKQGAEAIDSIRVLVLQTGGSAVDSITRVAPNQGQSASFNFTLPRGQFAFSAVPIARVGSVSKAGSPTAATLPQNSRQTTSDTVYVANRASCAGANGSSSQPYCHLDSAFAALGDGGGTIILRNATPSVPFEGAAISGTDSTPVVVTVPLSGGAYDPAHRVVFRGSTAKEALVITRKNVTLQGAIIEMPAAATLPALAVKAGGVTVDGCLFRPQTAAAAAGPALLLEPGATQQARVVNNVFWAYSTGIRINSASSGIRILHNTFIDEPTVNTTGSTTGIEAQSDAVNATIANNYFSGITRPYSATFAGKTPKLDHNAYTVSALGILQGLEEVGSLDSVSRLQSLDLTKSSFAADLSENTDFAMDCGPIKPCNGLYAGSSGENYGTVATDFTGKARGTKADIGAIDARPSTSSVRGILSMAVSPMADRDIAHDRLAYTITRGTFDPADVDTVWVWWSTGANVPLDEAAKNPGNIRRVAIARLSSGSFQDTIRNLNPLTTYYVYAALGKTTGDSRVVGYGYRNSATTTFREEIGDCSFGPANPVCPSNGYFTVAPPSPAETWTTQVHFALPDSGTVKAPRFEFRDTPQRFGRLEISAGMPRIILGISSDSLDKAGTAQSWRAEITMDQDPSGALKDQHLFILPTDSSAGLPAYVPTWSIKTDGPKPVLIIEGQAKGSFTYGFGRQTDLNVTPTLTGADPEPPLFDLADTARTVSLNVKGTGFTTANPLVLATAIPAGSTLGSEYANVADGKYANRTVMLSAGLQALDTGLIHDRFYRYFQRAAAAEADASGGTKPIVLQDIARRAEFNAGVSFAPVDIAVAPGGTPGQFSLRIPVDPRYRLNQWYADKRGGGSRSLEVVFTIFDGGRITRSSGFIRTSFTDATVHGTEKREFDGGRWNLYAYPWEELPGDSLSHVVDQDNWNPAEARIMKYNGTGAGAGAFKTYDGTAGAGLEYDAGRAVWTGARDPYTPKPRRGLSLDYEPFLMKISANRWNDFGLPFNFPIKWKDILTTSNKPMDLVAWRYVPSKPPTWERLKADGTSPTDSGSVIQPWDGLTMKPGADLELTFPVLSAERSPTPLVPATPKVAADGRWSVKLTAWNATATMNLRIGVDAREQAFGEAPDVPGQDFRVALKVPGPDGEKALSEHVRAFDGSWQGHWALKASAPGEGIRLRISDNSRDIPLFLVETLTRKVTPLAEGAGLVLSAKEAATGDYHIVAGDSRYVEDVLDGLAPGNLLALSNSPNPFSGSTLVRYGLPESFGKVEFRVKIRDSRGRLVLEKSFTGSNSLRWLWDGRDGRGKVAGAGFYTLSLEALTPGKAPRKAVRRLLKM